MNKSWTPAHYPSADDRLHREKAIRSLKRWLIAGTLSFLSGAALAWLLR